MVVVSLGGGPASGILYVSEFYYFHLFRYPAAIWIVSYM